MRHPNQMWGPLGYGAETRTSAPVQVVRDAQTCECATLRGLYPAGEGAGYAGGIVSAAVDGLRVADAVVAALGAPASVGGPPLAGGAEQAPEHE